MRIVRFVCTLSSLTLLLWLGAAAFGMSRPQGDNRDNRQDQAKPPEPKSQAPRPQQQPRPQAQSRPQAQPKPQEAPRAQTQPRPQAQTHPQQQARPQEQPKPQANRAPQQNARQAQPNENRRAAPNRGGNAPAPRRQQAARPAQGGGQAAARQGHTAPTAQDRQQARSYQSAKRVAPAQERTIFQQRRATNWGADHRDWRARGGYTGFRIPDARFNVYFGPSHFFHIYGMPLVYVGGYPEFQYEGYWFEVLDPIPPDWAPDFMQTDNVYINWDPSYGGYYLYDALHPGEAVAVNIVSG